MAFRPTLPSAGALGISQSAIMLGTLLMAFIIYIAQKGELPTYLSFFGIGGGSASSAGTSGLTTAATGATVGAASGLGSGAGSGLAGLTGLGGSADPFAGAGVLDLAGGL